MFSNSLVACHISSSYIVLTMAKQGSLGKNSCKDIFCDKSHDFDMKTEELQEPVCTEDSISNRKHEYGICSKQFSRSDIVLQHKRSVHGLDSSLNQQQQVASSNPTATANTSSSLIKYGCKICNKYFSSASNCKKHERNVHKIYPPTEMKLRCSECFSCFRSKKHFTDHLSQQHGDITMKTEKIIFSTHEQFNKWKLQMEKDTASRYNLHNYYKTLSSLVHCYSCHRSGHFKSKSKGMRRIKTGGTNKIGFFCPARICTHTYETSDVGLHIDVTFYSTHIGHQCEVDRLRLSKTEKEEIVGKLQAGVPVQHMFHDISETATPTKRFASTNAREFRNVSASILCESN